ncbi:MAG: hypothetical protein JO025_03625 [Verrucomicrobia bacterium]|nr:hypothetical protein [Verrucomicrobiota bacterium]
MHSDFLVFDLIAGNAGNEVQRNTRNRIDQKLMTVKWRWDLSWDNKVNRVPASPDSKGASTMTWDQDL